MASQSLGQYPGIFGPFYLVSVEDPADQTPDFDECGRTANRAVREKECKTAEDTDSGSSNIGRHTPIVKYSSMVISPSENPGGYTAIWYRAGIKRYLDNQGFPLWIGELRFPVVAMWLEQGL